MLNKRTKFLVLHSVAPLWGGTLIYLLWRSESLLVFRWLALIRMSDFVLNIRNLLAGQAVSFPEWFLYSLPDGLWVYAATNALGLLWLDDWRTESYLWVLLPLLVGCLTEMGQFAGRVPGTFSAIDLAAYLCGGLLGVLVTEVHRAKEYKHEIAKSA